MNKREQNKLRKQKSRTNKEQKDKELKAQRDKYQTAKADEHHAITKAIDEDNDEAKLKRAQINKKSYEKKTEIK